MLSEVHRYENDVLTGVEKSDSFEAAYSLQWIPTKCRLFGGAYRRIPRRMFNTTTLVAVNTTFSTRANMPYQPASSVLEDIRVLDLTRVRSGPTAVRQLADWGADVIKIEQPESIELFKKLVKESDVLVENFRPNVKHRLGIDYESLNELNPRLIYASISGFGQSGPYAKRPGFDQIAQGVGGLMSITGAPNQGPMRVGIPIADLCAGHFCAQGILLALFEREKSGKGQWLHTSLLQSMIAMLDFQAARWTVNGEVPTQAGNNHPTSIPTGVFRTNDGYINIAVAGEGIWQRFCEAIDRVDWLEHENYKNNAARSTNRDTLNDHINAITATQSSEFWIDLFDKAGVPCGSINSIDQTFADPQVQHLNATQTVVSEKLGELNLISQPVVLERTPSAITAAPPERGAQTQELLMEQITNNEQLSMSSNKMIARKDGMIGRIIFNNPERHNAVSLDMWNDASSMLTEFLADDDVRVIVLSGAGGKAFVSGADISKFESERATQEAVLTYNAKTAEVYGGVHQSTKPTIALIQGHCIGGGLGLAVACDLRFCTERSKFGLPAAKLGLGYPYAGLKRLSDIVGPGYAKEITFSGAIYDSATAKEMRLVNRILPDDELEEYVLDYANTIAMNAPMTVRAMKNIFTNIYQENIEKKDFDGCQAMVDACFASEDYIEGRNAFMEKRKPEFKGR